MKKIITIAAFMLLAVSSFCQEGRAIYNKYSSMDGVEAVYVSPTMFKLVGGIPSLKVDELDDFDLAPIIKSLNGFYLLEFPTRKAYSVASDVKKAVQNGKYELMMETKDGGDKLTIYTISKGEVITSFIMLAEEDDGEVTFICLDGTINQKDLQALVASAMK